MSEIPLICVPFAGAGASFFRPWAVPGVEGLRIVPLQPPGREWKLDQELYRDVERAAAGLLPEVVEQIDDGRVALFGHSLGAVLAYELACKLVTIPGVEIVRLIVSGSPGPWSRRPDRASGLADGEFLRRVEEFAGYSHEALADQEMLELILPVLRADVEMHENYSPSSEQPLPAPITAIRGASDCLVTSQQAAEWSKATNRDFNLCEVDGGHMYLTADAAGLLRLIADEVARNQH
ncbi:thioesterase II family protein [Nocardia colli]|uniref:thioesterase II family protein n=1 Tax=Nocardia colli TaxID=2545717 RepID=UPI0035D61DAD